MKKLLSIGVILSLLLALLTGCQSPGPEQDLGDKFILGEDNQYYFHLANILESPLAQSEDSYFSVSEGGMLLSKNMETGKTIPLCNKPDCMHESGNENCNACFGICQQISYYHNQLYILTADHAVYEVDKSGNTRTKRLEISDEDHETAMMVHRGYLYLAYTDFLSLPEDYDAESTKEKEYRVDRYRLDQWDGKAETIYEKKGEYGKIDDMFAYGNQLYLSFVSEKGSKGIIYNIVDQSTAPLPEINNYYTALDGCLLYFEPPKGLTGEESREELYQIRQKNFAVMTDLQGKVLGETKISQAEGTIFGCGDLIAVDNYMRVVTGNVPEEDRAVTFYNRAGELLCKVNLMTAEFPVMGMSEDFLFYKKETTVGGEGRIWAIDLHKLDDPDLKGEPFFVSEK